MKKKKTIKIPKYAFGAQEVVDAANIAGNVAQSINGGNQTAQTAFSGIGEIGKMIPGLAGQIVQGASALGKIGTAIVGTKGSVDEITGDITEGSGILGRKNRKKLQMQSGIVKNNIAAAQNSAAYAADWYKQNGYNDPVLFANGGIIPNTEAFLDDGENVRTPYGDITHIPEEGKPEDSNLVSVPVGSQVLSKKLKPKGSKLSYAEMYDKGKAKENTKGNGVYAMNTRRLNKNYNQALFNEILELQESDKRSNSSTNKYVHGTAGVGEPIVTAEQRKNKTTPLDVSANPNYNPNIVHNKDLTKQSWYTSNNPEAYQKAASAVGTFLKDKNNYNAAYKTLSGLPQIRKNTDTGMSFEDAVIKNIQDGLYGQVHDYFTINGNAENGNTQAQEPTAYGADRAGSRFIPQRNVQFNIAKPNLTDSKINVRSIKDKPKNYGWLNDLADASAGLIGPLMNITAKKGPSNVPYTYTPQYGPTEYNINPLLVDMNRNRAIANYNMTNINPNTGANMAFGIQSAINADNQLAKAYAEKNNQEANMAMQNANIYNNWGRFDADARHTAAVENAQDLAAVNQARRQGWSDLGTAIQTMGKDRRLMRKDKMLMAAMEPYLNKGMTSDKLAEIYSYLN